MHLLDHFRKNGWDIDLIPTISNSIEVLGNIDEPTFDTLGQYKWDLKNWSQIGEIKLFTNTIEHCAKKFLDNLPYPKTYRLEDCIEKLTNIVLNHELVHRLMHWGRSPEYEFGNKENKGFNLTDEFVGVLDPKFLGRHTESIPQIYTNYFSRFDNLEWMIFQWLEKGQPDEYKRYRDEILLYISPPPFVDDLIPPGHMPEWQTREVTEDIIKKIDLAINLIRSTKNSFDYIIQNFDDLISKKLSLDEIILRGKFGL